MARHLTPQDVVPRLRADLNVTAPPTGAGAEVVQIGPIGSTDRFALHGFEFSIALMLDGKRTVAELVHACERLGLPVELEALEGFFDQLKGYGLLAKGKPEVESRERKPWSPVVRALFRDALREVRRGDQAHARADLEQLLKVAPNTPEASALRLWLDAHPGGAPDGKTFEQLMHGVEEGWLEERRPGWGDLVRAAIHRSKVPFIVITAGLLALIAVVMVPLPRVVSASATLSPLTRAAFSSPASGMVGEVRVHDGDRVEAGQVIFTWDAADLDLRMFQVRNHLEAAREPLREEAGQTPAGRAWAAKLLNAEQDADRARAALWAEIEKGTEPSPALALAEQRVRQAETRIAIAQEALDALSVSDSPAALRAMAYEIELAALEQQRLALDVLAPQGGVISELNVVAGRPFAEDQTVAQIVDSSRMRVVATTTTRQAETMRPGEAATLRFGPLDVKTTIEAVSAYEVGAEVENPGGLLKTGSATVDIELAPRSIFERLR